MARPSIPSPEGENAWFALLFMHATVTAQIDAVLDEHHQISFSMFEILCRLLEREPQPVRALAAQLVSVSPTRASRLMQELVQAGRLERSADETDGRISLISFTAEGRRYARSVARTFERWIQDSWVDLLDNDDLAALMRIWHKLQAAQEIRRL